jgi:hypothetical protein
MADQPVRRRSQLFMDALLPSLAEDRDRHLRRLTSSGNARNGIPDLIPYVWRPGEAQRDAEVAKLMRAARRRALARTANHPDPEVRARRQALLDELNKRGPR